MILMPEATYNPRIYEAYNSSRSFPDIIQIESMESMDTRGKR
jgi:hypothetical protein